MMDRSGDVDCQSGVEDTLNGCLSCLGYVLITALYAQITSW